MGDNYFAPCTRFNHLMIVFVVAQTAGAPTGLISKYNLSSVVPFVNFVTLDFSHGISLERVNYISRFPGRFTILLIYAHEQIVELNVRQCHLTDAVVEQVRISRHCLLF